MNRHVLTLSFLPLLAVMGCRDAGEPFLNPLPAGPDVAQPFAPAARVSGAVGSPGALPAPMVSLGNPQVVAAPATSRLAGGGTISLNFADTDIREVVAQVLGGILGATYTIDPAVSGTATLRTAQPVTQAQLLPILQTLLAQNGASLVQVGGVYRIVAGTATGAPVAAALPGGAGPGPRGAGLAPEAGATVVSLRNASAEDLARVLQPFVSGGARISADPGRNALLIGGDPQGRDVLLGLIQAFDVDLLAGQSYALLPVGAGDARDFASAMQDALRGQGGGALSGVVRVVPMQRINAVLVVSSQRSAIEQARRVFALVERSRRQTVRSWSVYFLQNSRSNDIAYVLQQAFTPRNVTSQPTPAGASGPGRTTRQLSAGNQGGIGGGTSGGGLGGAGGSGSGGIGGVNLGSPPGLGTAAPGQGAALTTLSEQPQGGASSQSANPLLGGLDPTSGGGDSNPDTMRIVPNPQNNALLVYATPQERDAVEATLRRLDILPLQVRIDAVIAEVTLNDNLRFGTQFFFRSGEFNNLLTTVAGGALAGAFPGFVFAGRGLNGAPVAITALQAVTEVRVLSSPQLMVLDNEPARLQVGSLVPYLTQSAQSTLTAGAPIVSSVSYRETGVIMEVTPRVNSGGLVTLDIAQEVSDVDPTQTTVGINSPTFSQRVVRSRVAVQDGQTIGLAGLIRDNTSRGNQGIPYLRNIPLLGALLGNQNNTRQRTELLVLITPRVIHDQRDARALTEDLRNGVFNAALVPQQLNSLVPTGLADPQARIRRRLGLER